MISVHFLAVFISLGLADAAQVATDIASSYTLTTSTSMPFPTAPMANGATTNLLKSDWSLSKGRIQDGEGNLEFVKDPFPPPESGSTANSNETVLQVTYPAGSFSHNTGGSQFYSLWNSSSDFQSMMISYDIAFDTDFDFVKGGKLPGLRGGKPTGCSGGNVPRGNDCFSTRLMWRQNGNGEVYAYVPTPNGLCDQKSITCSDDFGVSVSRGSWTFTRGEWNRISVLIRLNDPVDTANGNIQLFFNEVNVLNQKDLQFRSMSNLTANGLYFSTFFGGSDDSWATPKTTHTYYKNIRLWGGEKPSDLTGQKVKNWAVRSQSVAPAVFASLALSLAFSWFQWDFFL